MEATMLARDIMTTDVCTFAPETTVLEAARLLVDRRISGAPVIDGAGRVIGIVSEGDLIRRAELGTEREWSGWREFLTAKRTLAHEFIRSHASKVGDIMTAPVWTVKEDTSLAELAELFEKKNIRRAPVVRDGKLAGIVSRADMVRALLQCWAAAHPPTEVDDAVIRQAILDHAASERWSDTAMLNVEVRDGAVDLYGVADSDEVAKALEVLAESLPGVKRVQNHLQMRTATRTHHAV
jgi:CBS domain-containing protein